MKKKVASGFFARAIARPLSPGVSRASVAYASTILVAIVACGRKTRNEARRAETEESSAASRASVAHAAEKTVDSSLAAPSTKVGAADVEVVVNSVASAPASCVKPKAIAAKPWVPASTPYVSPMPSLPKLNGGPISGPD